MFTLQQVKQFKEAFAMIDQDGDGRVTEADLRTMLTELGMSALRPTLTLGRREDVRLMPGQARHPHRP